MGSHGLLGLQIGRRGIQQGSRRHYAKVIDMGSERRVKFGGGSGKLSTLRDERAGTQFSNEFLRRHRRLVGCQTL
jgi:hypothetical protein